MTPPNADKHVLVVEDHPPTAELLTLSLDEVDPSISSSVVDDGRDCLAVLRREDGSIPYPDLVFLDLDLPEINGFTVLETTDTDTSFRRIPTLVLSSKDDPETVARCYERGATAFISKPDELDGFLSIAKTVVDHWFSTIELPATGQPK